MGAKQIVRQHGTAVNIKRNNQYYTLSITEVSKTLVIIIIFQKHINAVHVITEAF